MLLKWILFLTLFMTIPAHALDFSEFGLVGISIPSIQRDNESSVSSSPGLNYGGGASFGFPISNRIDLELGLVFSFQSFSIQSDALPKTQYKLTTVQIPILLRYALSKTMSMGAGPYLMHGIGNVKTSVNSTSGIVGYGDLAWGADDVGFVASFRYRTPLNEIIHLILDQRILIGTNMDTSGSGSLRIQDFQSWAGISYHL